jgi:hypothetical protein
VKLGLFLSSAMVVWHISEVLLDASSVLWTLAQPKVQTIWRVVYPVCICRLSGLPLMVDISKISCLFQCPN